MRHLWVLLLLVPTVAGDNVHAHQHCPAVEVAAVGGQPLIVESMHEGEALPARICVLSGGSIHSSEYVMLAGEQTLLMGVPEGPASVVVETETGSQSLAFAAGTCAGDYGLMLPSTAAGPGTPRLSCIEPQAVAGSEAPVVLLSFLAAFAVAMWLTTVRIPLLGLFSHIHGDAALEHDARQQIVDLVTENPGMRMHQIGGALGLGGSSLRHHVDVLVRTGHLHITEVGRHRHFFPAGRFDRQARKRIALLEDDVIGAAYERLEDAPITLAELAKRCGRSLSWTSRVVSRMVSAGLADKHRDGGRVLVRAVRS